MTIGSGMRMAMVFVVILCSCAVTVAPVVAEGPVTIEIGSLALPPSAERWVFRETESFQKAHPNIRIVTKNLVQPTRDAVPLSEQTELARNIIGVTQHAWELPYLVQNDLIVPIDKFLPDDDLGLDDFYPSSIDTVRMNDHVWAVPFAQTSWWLILDWELFEKAGIDTPPSTWEELEDCARRLTKDSDGDGRIDQYGFRITIFDYLLHYFLVEQLNYQTGVNVFDTGEPNFQLDQFRRNLKQIYDLTHAQYCYQDPRPMLAGSSTDDVRCAIQIGTTAAMYFPVMVNRHADLVKDQRLRFAPFPATSSKTTGAAVRLAFAIRKSTAEEEAASWAFLKWMNRDDAPLPDIWAGFPVRRGLLDGDAAATWRSRFCAGIEIPAQEIENSVTRKFPISDQYYPLTLGHIRSYMKGEVSLENCIANMTRDGHKMVDPRLLKVNTEALFK